MQPISMHGRCTTLPRCTAADIEGKANTSATLFSGAVGTKLDWFGTVRGRVGFLVTPSALLYGTGGWAYGHTTSSASAAAFGLAAAASVGHEKNGWTAGGGLEYAFNPWLSFKTEYLYLNLGTDGITSGTIAGVPFSLSEKTTVHTVKIGLNVSLVGGSPLVAELLRAFDWNRSPGHFPSTAFNLGFDPRVDSSPPQASDRGLLDRQCHCASAPWSLLPPDIAEDRAAKGRSRKL